LAAVEEPIGQILERTEVKNEHIIMFTSLDLRTHYNHCFDWKM